MHNIWLYSLISVIIVSIISLIGVLTVYIETERLKKILIYMVSFAAGALLGDAFIHLLPEAIEKSGITLSISIFILSGIVISFIIEKIIHWRHCHQPTTKNHPHPYAIMNLVGDCIHNFIDGLIIAGSYLINIPVGMATTLAVILHEIPQEMGDFGVLLHGGFSKGKALFFNFITALTAVIGVVIALTISNYTGSLTNFLIPFAMGSFIYIAGSDLIPELHKEVKIKNSIIQLVLFVFGILVMCLLLLLE